MSTPEYNLTDFRARVFDAVRAIPVGEVRTYGEIAQEVGSPGGGIAVGQAPFRSTSTPTTASRFCEWCYLTGL